MSKREGGWVNGLPRFGEHCEAYQPVGSSGFVSWPLRWEGNQLLFRRYGDDWKPIDPSTVARFYTIPFPPSSRARARKGVAPIVKRLQSACDDEVRMPRLPRPRKTGEGR